MATPKVEAVHLNAVPTVLKNKLKRFAKEDQRSLEKQIVFILSEYVAKR